MGGRCQLGSARALQQDRMREPLHPGDIDACRLGDLLDGRARANPGLNLLGTQHAWNLGIELGLADSGFFATNGGTQPVVSTQDELLGWRRRFRR